VWGMRAVPVPVVRGAGRVRPNKAGVSTLLKQANPEEALPLVLVSTASGMGPSIPI
jgi:hypothetical protein